MPDAVEEKVNNPESAGEELGIQRSTNQDETLERTDYSQKERDQLDDSDFGDPENQAFPIKVAQDVINAASRLHDAKGDQGAIKARIERIAKQKGFPLPQTWQEDAKSDDSKGGTQERALPDGLLALDGYNPHMTFPIVRTDAEKWMVYGRATVEEPDHHGTIFSYEGAKAAFARWKGNIREQHDIKKAVGKRVDYEFNDEEKGVYLTARVSKGAPDTWQKVMDDVLCDFSVNVLPAVEYGNDPRRWPKKEFNGKMYPYLPEYDYAEISLVDSGSAPGTQFTPIVRADGSPTEQLEVIDEEPAALPQTHERAGARVSSDTRIANHKSIGHTLRAAVSQMQNCGDDCPQCQASMGMIDPDGDGDIDMGGYDDPDGDWQSLYAQQNPSQDMERTIIGIVERALQPVYIRLQGIAGTLARSNATPKPLNLETTFETMITGAITRAVDAATVANASSLTEVRADLSAVREQVDAIANTPLPGAPVMNTSAVPRPVDKQLTTDPYARPQRSGSSVYDAVELMHRAGRLETIGDQVDAVATALAAQRGR